MRRLAEIDRHKLIDVLAERLASERAGVRLYDAICTRVASAEPAVQRMLPRLEQQRAEEQAHADWLDAQLVALEAGSIATGNTRRVTRVRLETEGLQRIADDGAATVQELFHALLLFELADDGGWELLVQLAARGDDRAAHEAFAPRREAERAHVSFVRRAVTELLINEVLGYPVTLPIGP
jgi:hypothetical protein